MKEFGIIQYVGIDDLDIDSGSKNWLIENTNKLSEKIGFMLKKQFNLDVHVKEYKQNGGKDKRHKFSIHMKIEWPGHTFATSKANDWDIKKSFHRAAQDMKDELNKKLKLEIKKSANSRKKSVTSRSKLNL